MTRKEIVAIIEQEKVVFVTRLKDATKVQLVIASLIKGGAKVMEITSNTPNYSEEISKARASYPHVIIGAGTVINSKIAIEAIKAGAQFLVSPNCSIELVTIAHQHGIPILMGALTPTEICEAWNAGADFVKLFPADIMGIPYFKSISGPLDNVKILAVGGIELHRVKDWMDAGAYGIGIVSVLKEPIENEEDYIAIEKNANNFINLLKDI
ncbi:bifunctional 4-hydroxy-2-oxoglutarate aldolase/2-dehydro-3-deoxy-phosphogluconate aldolase [Algibacter sp. 2305UL17-15]|uniref:bifunctional 4-hydroxy-2-oxoglutarate aldolase/2-dehydro-3-deoxy-phosphogluconate aldolase n=1 Tax=Algibacter sp. 2305UL17-15 TaxID=3231268 RepID=UPI003459B283